MGVKTKISWAEATWNPIRGCSRVSRGCENCYAERIAARFSGPGAPYEGLARNTTSGPRWTGRIRVIPEHLEDPLRWRKPRRIFLNSMSDLFHPNVTDGVIDELFGVMARAPQHDFLILTKRPRRMRRYFEHTESGAQRESLVYEEAARDKSWDRSWPCWPLPNVWLGVSVEDQATAELRLLPLILCPATVRFLSCEPILSPINLSVFRESRDLDWIIAGAESGPGARPMDEDWVRSLRDQCAENKIAFFYKQKMVGGRKVETPELDGRRWIEYPKTAAEEREEIEDE